MSQLHSGVCLLPSDREAVPQPVHLTERWPTTSMKVLLSILIFKVLLVAFLSRLQSFLPHGVPPQLEASESSDCSIPGGLQIPSSVPKESLGDARPS